MCKKILLITLIALSIIITGCYGGRQIKNDEMAPQAKQQYSSTNDTESIILDQTPQKFFGQWVITKHLANSRITAYSSDDIKKFLGRKASFSTEKAIFFRGHSGLDEVIINPIYKKKLISEGDFEFRTKTLTLAKLGITSDPAQEIEVSNEKKTKGCGFFIKDNDTLILADGGVYFELKRDE